MVLAPGDQAGQAVLEVDLRPKLDVGFGAARVSDPVAHQGRLAAWLVVDRLVGPGQVEQQFSNLLERSTLTGADVVEAVGHIRLGGADVGMRAIFYSDEIERLATVAQNGGPLAAVD